MRKSVIGQRPRWNDEPGVWRHREQDLGNSGFEMGQSPTSQLAPEAEHVILAEKCLLLLLLIVALVFNIQIYSVDTCSSDGILGAVPGAIER